MTTIMNQVTRWLCNIKSVETKWNEHLVSTIVLKFCKTDNDRIAKNSFRNDF